MYEGLAGQVSETKARLERAKKDKDADDVREFGADLAFETELKTKIERALEAARNLIVISIEIRPPDATYVNRGHVLHSPYSLDLSYRELRKVASAALSVVHERHRRVNRRRATDDVFTRMVIPAG